jgi:hypothetical protein
MRLVAGAEIAPIHEPGCNVLVHFNGTVGFGQGRPISRGSSHPPCHRVEEILNVTDGVGIIEYNGKATLVGPGDIMYRAGCIAPAAGCNAVDSAGGFCGASFRVPRPRQDRDPSGQP